MDKLIDAYDFIEHYRKRNKPVPDDVWDEARVAEVEWLQRTLTSAFQEHIQPILDKIRSDLTLVCEHTPGEPTQIFISREKDIPSLLDDAISLSEHSENDTSETTVAEPQDIDDQDIDDEDIIEEEENVDEGVPGFKSGKAKSIGFTVRFNDGKVVSRTKAKDTMVDVFWHMGLEKVATFKDKTFNGYRLVDRRKRTDKGGRWQEAVGDGWYVYVNMSNDTKKIMIQRVADALGVKLSIYDNIESGLFSSSAKYNVRKSRPVFSFNGKTPADKRNSVLAVVKAYAANHPNATFNEIRRSFPDRLQGSYGVVKSLDEIEDRRRQGQQVDNRYFLDPRDILTSADGVDYAVSNQWGDQFYQFQEHIKNFGWTLTEV